MDVRRVVLDELYDRFVPVYGDSVGKIEHLGLYCVTIKTGYGLLKCDVFAHRFECVVNMFVTPSYVCVTGGRDGIFLSSINIRYDDPQFYESIDKEIKARMNKDD